MADQQLDLIVAGGRVIDGSGNPSFPADVGIAGDRIAFVGDLSGVPASRRLDVAEATLAPGFIDVHVHSEVELLRTPVHEAGLRQGVTTHILGQDGFGFAPTTSETFSFMSDYLSGIYGATAPLAPGTVETFLARYDGSTTVNVATLVPAGCVRMNAMGNVAREPTQTELAAMVEECRRGMAEGAVGLSSGLDYVPGAFASTDELVALCEAVAPFGGVYVTHMRYRSGLAPALEEAVEIGRRAQVPVQVSHLFGDDTEDFGAEAVVAFVEAARAAGVDVTFDTYPYTYGSTTLAYPLPFWMLEGVFDDVLARLADERARDRVRAELGTKIASWSAFEIGGELGAGREHLIGLDVLTAAGEEDAVAFLCDLLLAERLDVLLIGVPSADPLVERGVRTMLRAPAHMMCSDGIYHSGSIHPRAHGAFARFIRLFMDEPGALPEAVRHATSASAVRFGLHDRGRIAPGYAADLIVFDPAAAADAATREAPRAPACGMRHVFVNGVPVLEDGQPTGRTPGRALRPAGVR